MIELLQPGALSTVQDLGRSGRLRYGVGRSGAMDPVALRLGNLLVGNQADAAGIEIAIFPVSIRFDAECAFALTGAATNGSLDGVPLPPDWTTVARPGQVLTLAPPQSGVFGYVCFAGGLDVPIVLGARATDLKGGFGGLQGRRLAAGDRLRMGPAGAGSPVPANGIGASRRALVVRGGGETPILCFIPAAEWDDLGGEATETFLSTGWRVGREVDRLGYRLSGPELVPSRRRELRSHGIVPGVIQLPAGGQPIVQMVEANTCGGYPKLGVIIEVDLPVLAQRRSGQAVRFQPVSWDEAVAARRDLDRRLLDLGRSLDLMRGQAG